MRLARKIYQHPHGRECFHDTMGGTIILEVGQRKSVARGESAIMWLPVQGVAGRRRGRSAPHGSL